VASLYEVYFDESGTHVDSEAAVVAGFVSNTTEWITFSQKWQQVLTGSHLDYFRMSEFENRRGQFSGWTENAKRDLLNKLLPIIDDHTILSMGCIVLKQSVDSLVSDVVKRICGDAYGLAALGCWRHLGHILQGADAWVDCSMEAGAKGSGALKSIFEEDSKIPEWRSNHRIQSLYFRDKRMFPQLQAADILAYELYKQSARQFGSETRAVRYPLQALGSMKHLWVYLNEACLREYNDDLTRQLLD
jgi:hypothetical protein